MGEYAIGLDDVNSKNFKNKYTIGEIVQHKTSGEKGIVTYVHKGPCQNPNHKFVIDCINDLKKEENPCLKSYIDLYDISINFDKQIDEVPGFLLQKVQ